jgi:hypothetical protein
LRSACSGNALTHRAHSVLTEQLLEITQPIL